MPRVTRHQHHDTSTTLDQHPSHEHHTTSTHATSYTPPAPRHEHHAPLAPRHQHHATSTMPPASRQQQHDTSTKCFTGLGGISRGAYLIACERIPMRSGPGMWKNLVGILCERRVTPSNQMLATATTARYDQGCTSSPRDLYPQSLQRGSIRPRRSL